MNFLKKPILKGPLCEFSVLSVFSVMKFPGFVYFWGVEMR